MEQKIKSILVKYLWLICMLLGGIGFLIVWFFMPHKSEIESMWQVVFKLVIFVIITLGIAFFPNKFKHKQWLLYAPLLFFLCFVIPKISYYGFVGFPNMIENIWGYFYTMLYLILYPAIMLSISFAYRLGGGKPADCIKLSLTGTTLLFAGLLDIVWFIVNPVEFPDVIKGAHHIKIFIGHYPSYKEAIIFALFHLPVVILILVAPLQKWIDALLGGAQE